MVDEAYKSMGIKVHKGHAEELRRILLDTGLYDKGLKPVRVGDFVIFPLKSKDIGHLHEVKDSIAIEFEITYAKFPVARNYTPGGYRAVVEGVPRELHMLLPSSYDIVGNIAIIKLPKELMAYKENIASAIIKTNRCVKGVYADLGVWADKRIRKLVHMGGEKNTTTLHREHGLKMRVDISRVYFSPRLATERMRVAKAIKNYMTTGLDMFAGIGPFSLLIAKMYPKICIWALDFNPVAIELLKYNISLNNLRNRIIPVEGESHTLAKVFVEKGMKFDFIIMNLPHNAIDFLLDAFNLVSNGGMIFLYAIVQRMDGVDTICHRIKKEAKIVGKKATISEWHIVHPYSPKEDMMAFYIYCL